jgi:hypothetical protein
MPAEQNLKSLLVIANRSCGKGHRNRIKILSIPVLLSTYLSPSLLLINLFISQRLFLESFSKFVSVKIELFNMLLHALVVRQKLDFVSFRIVKIHRTPVNFGMELLANF